MERTRYLERIKEHFSIHSVCGLLGPRQCGKTTLADQYCQSYPGEIHRFDLENPDDWESLNNPLRALERLKGLVVIDEIQRLPDLFPVLRVLVDRKQAQYLVLGSASRALLRQSSESLAGRIGYVELTPFNLKEGVDRFRLFIRGGFPLSYLAETEAVSLLWRESYIQTFLERDVPALGFSVPPMLLRRFWMMLVHVHGNQFNGHQLGISLGLSGHTVRSYLDILEGTFMMRVLYPWFENIGKRQVKTPKIYFRDNGILLALLKIQSEEQVIRHPFLGNIWEGFALEQVVQSLEIRNEEAFYWRTTNGAELDLFVHYQGKRLGFEFKYADAPKRTRSMLTAINDLNLDHLYVIYPGTRTYSIDDRISVMSIDEIKDYRFGERAGNEGKI